MTYISLISGIIGIRPAVHDCAHKRSLGLIDQLQASAQYKTDDEIVKTLKPSPEKTAAHVEFDKEAKHALLSLWDMDGELMVYDVKVSKK